MKLVVIMLCAKLRIKSAISFHISLILSIITYMYVQSTQSQDTRHYSSEEDGETTSVAGTDTEDLEFCDRPFNKERLKEQLEAGGGIVYR